MPKPREITAAKQLLVEGRDAAVFFTALMRHMELAGIHRSRTSAASTNWDLS